MTAAPPRQEFRPLTGPAPVQVLSGVIPADLSGFQRLGYGFLVVYLFLIYSRIFDVKFSNLHIPGISYRVILVMVLLSRAFVPALKGPVGRAMAFFTLWFIAAIPTSMWKGGSTQMLYNTWLPNFVVFLATAGLIVNFEQCRRAVYTVAWAFFVLTLIAVFWGSTEETGRLFLPHGKFSNPNEMAQALLLGMPLWGMIVIDSKSMGKKAFAGSVMMLMLYMASKTGSRGAMVAFAITLFVVFFRASMMGKFKLIVGGVVVLAIIVGLMPGKLQRRYSTLSEDPEEIMLTAEDYDTWMEQSAISSTRSRKELLRKSIKFTLQHPLFGVGPGMFTVAEDADAKANGKHKGAWLGTHNSYTQVSSEMGIPGLIGYMAIMGFALKKTHNVYKRTRGDPRLERIGNCAMGLNYCLIVYAISVFFDYIAFTSMLSVFGGLAAALDMVAPGEIERIQATPLERQPIPFAQFQPTWRPTAGVPQQV